MASNTLKRVKLSFKDDKLVMPIDKTSGKVLDAILAPATIRFRAQRLLGKEDSFIQVRTLDGYIINPNDNIEDVVEQNDHLVLVNRDTWIKDFKSKTELTYWYAIVFLVLASRRFVGQRSGKPEPPDCYILRFLAFYGVLGIFQ